MQLPDGSQAKSWEGRDVVDSDGQPLGRCTGVFADTATGVAEWLDVDVEGQGRSFVPAVGAEDDESGAVRVRFGRDAVLAAPAVGDQVQLSKAEEIELYRHYGVPVEATEEGSVLPADAAVDAPADTQVDTPVDAPVATATVPPAVTPTTDAVAAAPESERQEAGAASPAEPPRNLDEPERASAPPVTGSDAPAAPRLRRVEPVPPSAPPSGTPSRSSDLSGVAPLGAVAGVVALVALGLRAREQRQRSRNSPSARAERLRHSVKAGSTSALASAGASLAAVPDATASSRRAAADAAAAAARRRREAAQAAQRQRKQAQAALAAAGKAASASTAQTAASLRATTESVAKTAAEQRKAAAKAAAAQRKAAAKAAAAQREAATKAAAAQRKAAAASLSSASRRTGSATSSVVAVPTRVARRGRKLRRSVARKVWDAVLLSAAGGGYVMGAKAGRERYDELAQVASAVASSPRVQSATAAVSDPERRSDLLLEVQQQAGALLGRRGQRRS